MGIRPRIGSLRAGRYKDPRVGSARGEVAPSLRQGDGFPEPTWYGTVPRKVVPPVRAPEILAPAGDRDALSAALAAGADAVYLGLDDGFNARARAVNFASDGLAEVAAWVHRAGARLYITL